MRLTYANILVDVLLVFKECIPLVSMDVLHDDIQVE